MSAEQASEIAEPDWGGAEQADGYEQGVQVGEQVDALGVLDAEAYVAGEAPSTQTQVSALCHLVLPYALS